MNLSVLTYTHAQAYSLYRPFIVCSNRHASIYIYVYIYIYTRTLTYTNAHDGSLYIPLIARSKRALSCASKNWTQTNRVKKPLDEAKAVMTRN